MTIKISTGLREHLAVTGSIKSALDLGFIKFYNGTAPAEADDAVAGSLLWTVSVDGGATGLSFDAAAVDAAAVKPDAVTWCGATVAGTPTYWRFVTAADTGVLSTTQKRIQGSCGNTAGVDIFLTNPILTTDTDLDAKELNDFAVSVLTN
jgi:hypothetical protein